MQRVTSDSQLEYVWAKALAAGVNNPTRTVDRWGEPFTIFGEWSEVEAVAAIIYAELPSICEEFAPSWGHLPQDRQPDPRHHIEWAIGEFGFSDQYSTCDNCYTAICTDDMYQDFYLDNDQGFYMCGDCLRKNKNFADDYLAYCARKLEEEGCPVIKRMANPADFGFVCLNAKASYYTCQVDHPSDHPNYPDLLTFAGSEEVRKLAKAARLIDPSLQVVYYSDGGCNVIFARFNPSDNGYYADHDGDNWREYPMDDGDGVTAPSALFGYATSRMFAKWRTLAKVGSR